jgi:glucosamine-phosphate N-acetyltransferase
MAIGQLRRLEQGDFYKNYLGLLKNLTVVYEESISYAYFCQFVNNLHHNHLIYVLEDTERETIIASGTLLIEPKLIHGGGKVAHIEDIVVHMNYRHQKHGTTVVQHLLAQAQQAQCYKAILDCTPSVAAFYQQCHLTTNGTQMSLYFT